VLAGTQQGGSPGRKAWLSRKVMRGSWSWACGPYLDCREGASRTCRAATPRSRCRTAGSQECLSLSFVAARPRSHTATYRPGSRRERAEGARVVVGKARRLRVRPPDSTRSWCSSRHESACDPAFATPPSRDQRACLCRVLVSSGPLVRDGQVLNSRAKHAFGTVCSSRRRAAAPDAAHAGSASARAAGVQARARGAADAQHRARSLSALARR
jgi:hypothetical protein